MKRSSGINIGSEVSGVVTPKATFSGIANVGAPQLRGSNVIADISGDGMAACIAPGQVLSYPENQSAGSVVGQVYVSGKRPPIGFRFMVTGTDLSADGYFKINATGRVTITAAGAASPMNNFEVLPNSFGYSLQVKDPETEEWSPAETVTLSVTDIQEDLEGPELPLSLTFNYMENREVGELIGTVPATDETGVATFRFTATGTQTSLDGYYAIDDEGNVTLTEAGASGEANDFEFGSNSFVHSVQAQDTLGQWGNILPITFNVEDVDEDLVRPMIAMGQVFEYVEGQPTGQLLGVVAASDDRPITMFRFADTQSTMSADGFLEINETGELRLTAQGAEGGSDVYFDKTWVLIHGGGQEGSNDIRNYAAVPKSITALGSVAYSSAASSISGTSLRFSGADTDYVTVGQPEDWTDMDSPNEAWVIDIVLKVDTFAHTNTLFSTNSGDEVKVGIYCAITTTGGIGVVLRTDNVNAPTISATFPNAYPLDTENFHQVSITWNGYTGYHALQVYVDGKLVGTAWRTGSATSTSTPVNPLRIGYSKPGYTFEGYIEEFRLTKGVTRYPTQFYPPKDAFDPAYDPDNNKTLLLMGFDGDVNGTVFTDSSNYARPVTVNGNIRTVATARFGTAAQLDGTGFLSVPDSDDWNFGTGDFTMEFWGYGLSPASGAVGVLFGQTPGATAEFQQAAWCVNVTNTGSFTFNASSGAGSSFNVVNTTLGSGVSDLVWRHYAIVRQGSQLLLFTNGVISTLANIDFSGAMPNVPRPFTIGRGQTSGGSVGYIDDLRVTKGFARYTGAPPVITTPYPHDIDPYYASNALIIHGYGEQDSVDIMDVSAAGTWVDVSGNVHISTEQFKFNGSSMKFDGNGDYLTVGVNTDWRFLHDASVWTAEGFARITNTGKENCIFSTVRRTGSEYGIYFGVDASRSVICNVHNGGGFLVTLSAVGAWPSDGEWHHWVLCYTHAKATNNLNFYLDGVLVASATKAGSVLGEAATALKIGSYGTQSGDFQGFMAELRFTKNVDRYSNTSKFAVPTLPYPEGFSHGINAVPTSQKLFEYALEAADSIGFGAPRVVKLAPSPAAAPAFWVDTSDSASLTVVNTNQVSQIKNKGTTGGTLTALNGNSQLLVDHFELPTLQLDGSMGYKLPVSQGSGTDMLVFMVMHFHPTLQNKFLGVMGSEATMIPCVGMFSGPSNWGQMQGYSGSFGTDSNSIEVPINALAEYWFSPYGSWSEAYLNGAQVGKTSSADFWAWSVDRINGNTGYGGDPNYRIGEIRFYRPKLSMYQRRKIRLNMAMKWGMLYETEVLSDQPVFYYRLNETSGTTAYALPKHFSNKGTYLGGVTRNQPGFCKSGKSVFFDAASGGKVQTGYSASHTANFTMECFFNPAPTGHDAKSYIMGRAQNVPNSSALFSFAVWWNPATNCVEVTLSKGDDLAVDATFVSQPITPGNDHHVAFVYRGGGLCELFIDAVRHVYQSINFSINADTQAWTIGTPLENGAGLGNSSFEGRIGEVALYSRSLPASRIKAHYDARL